tara:strand:- start:206 stop:934 length:729 start_codon:yes stop_codon:yes gene_type:complete
MKKFKVLIPIAGKGTRSKLDYPKCLFKIKGVPILTSILTRVYQYDDLPCLIVSKNNKYIIAKFLKEKGFKAELIVQENQLGMGDSVLQFKKSNFYKNTTDIILLWGDIPYLHIDTISKTFENHNANNNDFTFPTMFSDRAYTIVKRKPDNSIFNIIETRENNNYQIENNEREIGFFIFKSELVFNLLSKNLINKYGYNTGEHGFLYIVEHLVKIKKKVVGLRIAKKIDNVSFNSPEDLAEFI